MLFDSVAFALAWLNFIHSYCTFCLKFVFGLYLFLQMLQTQQQSARMKCVMWVAFGLDLVGLGWLSGALGTFVSPRRTIKLFRARGQKRGFNLSELDWRYLQRFAALSNTPKKKKKNKNEEVHTHSHVGKFLGKTQNKFGVHSVFICWFLCTKFIYISSRRICHFLWRPNWIVKRVGVARGRFEYLFFLVLFYFIFPLFR